MLEPLGPLPEAVYWRRRCVALGGLVAVALFGLWGVSALAGGGDAPASPGSALSDPGPASGPPVAGSPAPSSVPPSSAVRSSAALGARPVPSSSPPSGARGSCPDQVIGLTAQPAAAQYRPGQPREFRMLVANVGHLPCSRDLDPALQEVVVLAADGARLWSSNDCYGGGGSSVRTLAPGQQLVFGVVWAGRTSQPGCPAQRDNVSAGSYQLVVKLGPLTSRAVPFQLLD